MVEEIVLKNKLYKLLSEELYVKTDDKMNRLSIGGVDEVISGILSIKKDTDYDSISYKIENFKDDISLQLQKLNNDYDRLSNDPMYCTDNFLQNRGIYLKAMFKVYEEVLNIFDKHLSG